VLGKVEEKFKTGANKKAENKLMTGEGQVKDTWKKCE
jgi:hypothetical protein